MREHRTVVMPDFQVMVACFAVIPLIHGRAGGSEYTLRHLLLNSSCIGMSRFRQHRWALSQDARS